MSGLAIKTIDRMKDQSRFASPCTSAPSIMVLVVNMDFYYERGLTISQLPCAIFATTFEQEWRFRLRSVRGVKELNT